MAIEGVDYSWSRPNPATLYRAGKRFACRYVGAGSAGKHLTASEATRLRANGLAVVLNCEGVPRDPLLGYGKGVSHARLAYDGARAAGVSMTPVIYFSVDWDASNADLSKVDAYMDGAASVIGRQNVGVYGGYRTIARYASNRKAVWYWQTYAWSQGKRHSAVHIYQYHNGVSIGGADVDLNRAYKTSYGAPNRWKGGVQGAPQPDPAPQGPIDWDYNSIIDSGGTSAESYATSSDSSARAIDAIRKL